MSKKKSINKASAKASKTSWLSRTWQAFTSDKTLFIIGILLLLASLYMALSFASYILSSGGIDQSVLEADGAAADYNNMGGKRGAWIAEVLINRSFGITACIIPILTAVYGLQLMRIRKGGFKLVRWTIICCSILIWGSVFTNVTFGHLSDRMSYHIGGWHGKFVTDWLTNQIGLTGVFIVLFITAILFCIYLTSDTITFIRRLFHPSSFLPGKDEEEEEYIVSDKTSDFNLQTSDEIPAKDSDAEVFSNSLKPAIKLSEKVPESEDEEEFVEGRPASDRTVHLTGEPGFDVTAASETETVSKLQHEEEKGPYDPKKDLSRYKYPTLDLLNKGGDDAIAIDREEQDKNYHDITETLRSFGIEISSI